MNHFLLQWSGLVYSKMFIGGLNWDTTDGKRTIINHLGLSLGYREAKELEAHHRACPTVSDGLSDYFSQFGRVLSCTVMRDPSSGRSRGFAFLTFEDPASVNDVMIREHFLDGKAVGLAPL